MKKSNSSLIEDLIWIHDQEKHIIHYQESVSTSKEQLDYNFNQIVKLTRPFKNFTLILDLSKAERPGPDIREHILKNFELIKPKLIHVAIFTGKNFILNIAATFILKRSKLGSFSVHKTLKEAEEYLEQKK